MSNGFTRLFACCLAHAVCLASAFAVDRPRPALGPDTVWADQTNDIKFSEPIRVSKSRFAEYPAIQAVGGELFLAWTENRDGRDRILLATARGGLIAKPIVISGESQGACWPALTAVGGDGLCAAWAAKQGGRWTIAVRMIRPQLDTQITYIPFRNGDRASNRWHPTIACSNDLVYLAWERTDGNASTVVATSFRDPGELASGSLRERGKLNDVSGAGRAFRPDLAARDGVCWLAWDEVVGDRQYEVFISRLGESGPQAPIRATRHPSLDAAPAIAIDDTNRVWLAWHSDRCEDRQWDIPKWIHVRCFDGERWFAPKGNVPGAQDDPRGEDQGFEFPTLGFDDGGGLWLFGRPSHGFNAVRYGDSAWSSVYRFSRPGWGGRGRRVRCALIGKTLWTVRRDLRHILLQAVEPPPEPVVPLLVTEVARRSPNADTAPIAPPGAYLESPNIVLPDGYRLAFGDIHMHSWLSDGVGSPDEIYVRARQDYRIDFAALTDHDDFIDNRILPAEWDRIKTVADLFNQPGSFATLRAFEWTDPRVPKGDGHKNVFYRDDGPMLWHTEPETHDGAALVARLHELRGICIGHHIGWTGVNWDTHDPVTQPNMEICSEHGAYEYMGNLPIKHRGGIKGCFVRDGLAKGKTFGIVGGSDSHGLCWHHGIARRRNPWTHGLTAVLVSEISREAVWDALAARRCYATSGPKIALDFRVDGNVMGSEYTATQPPVVTAQVAAPSRLQYVTVIRNGQEVYSTGGDVNTARLRFVDHDWRSVSATRLNYYLRVVLLDGEMAWSSPVFVHR